MIACAAEMIAAPDCCRDAFSASAVRISPSPLIFFHATTFIFLLFKMMSRRAADIDNIAAMLMLFSCRLLTVATPFFREMAAAFHFTPAPAIFRRHSLLQLAIDDDDTLPRLCYIQHITTIFFDVYTPC